MNLYLAVGEVGEPEGANYTEADPSVGYSQMFTLTPVPVGVPEPMSLTLLGSGLLGLGLTRRRRREPAD